MRAGVVMMAVNTVLALSDFALFLNFSYASNLHSRDTCILLRATNGSLVCEPAKHIDAPFNIGYAFSATVVNFVLSIGNTLIYLMGSLNAHAFESKDE